MPCLDYSSFFLLVILFALIPEGTGLKCYVCKSSRDEPCSYSTTTNGVAIQECSNSDDICFHIDYNVNATKGYPQYAQSGCISRNSTVCPPPPSSGYVSCSVCDTNLCNHDPANETNNENNIDGNLTNNDKGGDGSVVATPMPVFIMTCVTLLASVNNV